MASALDGCREGAAVEIGLHVAGFTYPDGPAGPADDLTRVAVAAERAGFARRPEGVR